jgi:hypothetical protein
VVGGVDLWRTDNSGGNWTKVSDPNLHADHHRLLWNGSILYDASDGGLAWSNDLGWSWNTDLNHLGITQYVNFDIGVSNPDVIMGGTQDNGISLTYGGGYSWYFVLGGDGGGVAIDPGTTDHAWATSGLYDDAWAWHRLQSVDAGWNWVDINAGVDPSSQWFTKIRHDHVPPVWLYTNSGPWVYKSTDEGAHWAKSNTAGFPFACSDLTVSRYSGGSSMLYAPLDNPTDDVPVPGAQLRVFDGTSWNERSSGLSTQVEVRTVKPHPQDTNRAYALMKGFSDGEKVYRTTNKGVSWTNISGDLPNIPMGDLVPHPTDDNRLYVGSEFGCYRTSNGGVTWERWNNGMPEATIITEMNVIDRRTVDGTYYIVAASYGRGFWKREISGDDPTTEVAQGEGSRKFEDLGFAGNPVRESGVIRFRLSEPVHVTLQVYDVTGRRVLDLLHGETDAGEHEVTVRGTDLPAGTYWYVLQAGAARSKHRIVILG